MAGLFFCLASAEGAGLLFRHAAIQPHTSVYSSFCAVHTFFYTTHTAKQCTWLCRRFSCHLPCFAAVVWRVHPSTLHCLRHAGAYHSAATPPAHTRYHSRAGTLDRPAQPSYYNKVYKGAGARLLWIHARRCNTSQTMPARRRLDASHARRLAVWHRVSR